MVHSSLPGGAPYRVVLDDTLLRRSGSQTHGVAWRHDPLGSRFQTNFVRAQRFLQFPAAVPCPEASYRTIPIAFLRFHGLEKISG